MIGAGYLAARVKMLRREHIQGLGIFVMSFALPALIMRTIASKPIDTVLDWRYLGAYAAGSLVVFWTGYQFSTRIRKRDSSESAILALGMSASNSGFIGFPLVLALVGESAGVAVALSILVEQALMIPLALIVAERAQLQERSWTKLLPKLLRRLGSTPMIIGISIGLALSVTGIEIGPPLSKPLEMLAGASAPVALFVIGGLLFGLKPAGMFLDVNQVAFGKLVLHPVFVGLFIVLLPGTGNPSLVFAAAMFASVPTMSAFPLVGQQFGMENRCAGILFFTTLLSFFSISAIVYWHTLA